MFSEKKLRSLFIGTVRGHDFSLRLPWDYWHQANYIGSSLRKEKTLTDWTKLLNQFLLLLKNETGKKWLWSECGQCCQVIAHDVVEYFTETLIFCCAVESWTYSSLLLSWPRDVNFWKILGAFKLPSTTTAAPLSPTSL